MILRNKLINKYINIQFIYVLYKRIQNLFLPSFAIVLIYIPIKNRFFLLPYYFHHTHMYFFHTFKGKDSSAIALETQKYQLVILSKVELI